MASATEALLHQLDGLVAALQQVAGGGGPGGAPATAAPAAEALAPPASAAATDSELVQRAVAFLERSPTARGIMDQVRGTGTSVTVLSDSEFADRGYADSGGWYDTNDDRLYLRRSRLERLAGGDADVAMTFVHELAHAADEKAGIGKAFAQANPPTAVTKLQFDLAHETRAHMVEGRVRAELDLHDDAGRTPADRGVQWAMRWGDPAYVAAAGGTYDQVWQTLMASKGYNPTGMQVPPVVLT